MRIVWSFFSYLFFSFLFSSLGHKGKFIFYIILHLFFIFRFIYYFLNVKNLILSYKSIHRRYLIISIEDYYFFLKDDVINQKQNYFFIIHIFKIYLWISIQVYHNNVEKYFKFSPKNIYINHIQTSEIIFIS